MLSLPNHHETFRVLGIDPGSSSLGLSILEWSMESSHYVVTHAETLSLTGKDFPLATEHHGQRLSRHLELEDKLHSFLAAYKPHAIASESPFMGQFATAFKALSECLIILQRYMYLYDPHLAFHYYAPKEVKSAVGVVLTGNKGRKKEDNQLAIFSHPQLTWHIDKTQLDDNAVDATAVALTHLRGLAPC